MKVSLDLKLALLMFAMMLATAAVAMALLISLKNPGHALLLAAAAAVVPALLAARRAVRPVHRVLRAMLQGGVVMLRQVIQLQEVIGRDPAGHT